MKYLGMRAGDLNGEPYAKYWNPHMGALQPQSQQALLHGEYAPELGFPVEEANQLLRPGYLRLESGYTQLENGQLFIATHTYMPGVTGDMIDWWFGWHYMEDQRYKICRADLVPTPEESRPVYETMAAAMGDFVDLFLCETMSSTEEAKTAATAASRHGAGKPVYVSWTLDETPGRGLRSGETIGAAHAALDSLDIAAFLFNCTHPEAIEVGLTELRGLTDKPVGCYPNRLNKVPAGWTLDNEITTGLRQDLPVDVYVTSSLRCIEKGATIVGGCCGIGPEYIRALSERLDRDVEA